MLQHTAARPLYLCSGRCLTAPLKLRSLQHLSDGLRKAKLRGSWRHPIRHSASRSDGEDQTESQKPNELLPQDSELFIQGSDTSFLIKLLFISIGGAAVVKYGSLLLDAPFQPDAGLGLTLVLGPCLIYSIALLYKSREESTQ
ncbi:hypothetical protein WJX74_006760 [Apatococcus lobatus]|uniref:Uncharacterized protein n=2 Tax=Apatococcus TaxID=904362 RepID=A0AAW1SVA4_9CHLO